MTIGKSFTECGVCSEHGWPRHKLDGMLPCPTPGCPNGQESDRAAILIRGGLKGVAGTVRYWFKRERIPLPDGGEKFTWHELDEVTSVEAA